MLWNLLFFLVIKPKRYITFVVLQLTTLYSSTLFNKLEVIIMSFVLMVVEMHRWLSGSNIHSQMRPNETLVLMEQFF